MSFTFGILRGNVNDTYSMLGRTISGFQHSVVGVFCTRNETMDVVLFRTFDGSRILVPFYSIQDIVNSDIVDSLEITSFYEEEWNVSHDKHVSLENEMSKNISETLLLFNEKVQYNYFLKIAVGLQEPQVHIPNGYRIVNDIVSKTLAIPITEHEKSFTTLLERRFMRPWIQPTFDDKITVYNEGFRTEVQSSTKSLSDCFISLLNEDKFYANRIYDLTQRNTTVNEIYTVDHSSLVDEVNALRTFITELIQPQAIIQLIDIVRIYNQMASKVGTTILDTDHFPPRRSSSVIIVKSFPDSPIDVDFNIRLNSGTRIITSTQTSFQSFSEDELVQILRYIRSLDSVDGRFHALTDAVVRELASRLLRVDNTSNKDIETLP